MSNLLAFSRLSPGTPPPPVLSPAPLPVQGPVAAPTTTALSVPARDTQRRSTMSAPPTPATAVSSCVTPEAGVGYTMSPRVLPTVVTSSREVFFGAPASPKLEQMRAARSRALATICSAPIMWHPPSVTMRTDLLDSHMWRQVPPAALSRVLEVSQTSSSTSSSVGSGPSSTTRLTQSVDSRAVSVGKPAVTTGRASPDCSLPCHDRSAPVQLLAVKSPSKTPRAHLSSTKVGVRSGVG